MNIVISIIANINRAVLMNSAHNLPLHPRLVSLITRPSSPRRRGSRKRRKMTTGHPLPGSHQVMNVVASKSVLPMTRLSLLLMPMVRLKCTNKAIQSLRMNRHIQRHTTRLLSRCFFIRRFLLVGRRAGTRRQRRTPHAASK
jgi:hypothetical protein